MRRENGITLVALIITIIILVILAAVSVAAVYNMGIVNYAVNGTQNYASAAVAENQMLGNTENLLSSTTKRLDDIEKGKNEYGIYVDRKYICRDYFSGENDFCTAIIKNDGTVVIETWEENMLNQFGGSVNLKDFTNQNVYAHADNVQPNVKYTGTGLLNSQCSGIFDENGNLAHKFIISKENITYSLHKINIGNMLIGNFTEDGTKYTLQGVNKTFVLE